MSKHNSYFLYNNNVSVDHSKNLSIKNNMHCKFIHKNCCSANENCQNEPSNNCSRKQEINKQLKNNSSKLCDYLGFIITLNQQ